MNEATKSCSFCGAVLQPGVKYCESCGQPVDTTVSAAAAPEAVVPPGLEIPAVPAEEAPILEPTPPMVEPTPPTVEVPPTQTGSGSATPPPPPPFTHASSSFTPPAKKKFPVWAIIVIVLVALCMCGFLIAGGIYLVGKAAMPGIEEAVNTAVQEMPELESAMQTLTAIPELMETAVPNIVETTIPEEFTEEPTAEAQPDATSGETFISDTALFDDFSGEDLDWAVYQDTVGDQGYEDGQYFIHVTESAYVIWAYVPGDFYPTSLEFDAKIPEGYEENGTLGVLCNYQNEDEYTYVDIDVYNGEVQFGYSTADDLLAMTDEDWITVDSFDSNVNASNHYAVTCDPNSISLSVNGVFVSEVPVTITIDSGDMALYGFTWDEVDSNGMKALFDNVEASE